MQKQKPVSKMPIKLLHKTKNRARFSYHSSADPLLLRVAIDSIHEVSSVRINSIIKSIIITYSGSLDEIQNQIINILNSNEIQSQNKNKKDSYIALRSEIPSSVEVVRAASALAIAPFLTTPSLSLIFSLLASFPLLKSGLKETISQGITSRSLEAAAVAISLYLKDYKAANSTNFMLTLGEYIEELTMYKSDDLIKELSKQKGGMAWVETIINGKPVLNQIPSQDIQIGNIVVVGAGDTIYIDGHIVDGEALINQISMTGEAAPASKSRGDRVLSGTIVQEGKIKIWAEAVGDQTATNRVKSYIQSTLNERSNQELTASKMADSLVPITLSLAGLSYAMTGELIRAASVLQADYSCALKLTTPVAFKSAISSAAKEGIIVKGAKSLESLQLSEIFVFDKTGTLTNGDLEVLKVYSFHKEWDANQVLNLAASIEEHYFHPVAQAVVKAAKEDNFHHFHHDEVTFIVAHGVKSEVGKKSVIIGSRHFLEDDENISFKDHQNKIEELLINGDTPLYIGFDGKLLGVILLKDSIRPNAKKALARLKKSGVKEFIMLTGDSQSKASSIAKELGIERYYAQLLPTDKAHILDEIMQKAQKSGQKVAFVGDGINDAPALVRADTGISMHKGADIAKASADVVLLRDDIEAVADARELAISCLSRVNNSFKVTVGVNSLILILATLGKLSPIQTAIAHNGTTIALLLNALRRIKIKDK